jgi:hypothetical protein
LHVLECFVASGCCCVDDEGIDADVEQAEQAEAKDALIESADGTAAGARFLPSHPHTPRLFQHNRLQLKRSQVACVCWSSL